MRCPDGALRIAQPGEHWTLWVKRADAGDYGKLKGVDPGCDVYDLAKHWVCEEKLDVRPALVKLLLAKCGARKPTPAEEDAAVELDDPSLTLAGAGITGTAWLLAFVAAAPPGEC